MSTFESCAVLTPRAVAIIGTSALASLSIARTGYRKPMLVGMALVVLTLVILSAAWTSIPIGGFTFGGFWLMALVRLEMIFRVLAAVMLVAVAMALLIPDRSERRASAESLSAQRPPRRIRVFSPGPVGILHGQVVRTRLQPGYAQAAWQVRV